LDVLHWPCLGGYIVVAVVAEVNLRIVGIVDLYRKNFIFSNGHGSHKVSSSSAPAKGFGPD
jgi:hypothetical protein